MEANVSEMLSWPPVGRGGWKASRIGRRVGYAKQRRIGGSYRAVGELGPSDAVLDLLI